jgi:hypothetical protein
VHEVLELIVHAAGDGLPGGIGPLMGVDVGRQVVVARGIVEDLFADGGEKVAETTVFRTQAEGDRRGSQNFSGTGSPGFIEPGHQDAPVAERDFHRLAWREFA